MTTPNYDLLHQRGRVLEETFFAARDQQLLQALQRKLSAEEAHEVLASATGVSEKIAIRELANLPVPQFLAVLGIFPLVAVAWSDGDVSAAERKAVLAAAHDLGVATGSPSHNLLDRWLEARPSEGAIELWSKYVQAVCQTLKTDTVATLKSAVIGRAEKIALAAGGVLGFGNKISAAEQACLDQLSLAFDAPPCP